MKSNTNITLDTEVLLEVKGCGINLSKTLNDFLIEYLPTVKKNGNPKKEEQIKILKASLKLAEKKLEEKEDDARVIIKG